MGVITVALSPGITIRQQRARPKTNASCHAHGFAMLMFEFFLPWDDFHAALVSLRVSAWRAASNAVMIVRPWSVRM